MTPDGRFHVPLDAAAARHYVAFAAGSGITPVLSLIRTTLAREPRSRFTLVYGNRSVDSIIFSEALEDLKNQYLSRFTLYHVLSRQPQEVDLLHGRLDRARVAAFLETLIPVDDIDAAFVCGPASMIDEVEAALKRRGPGSAPDPRRTLRRAASVRASQNVDGTPRRATPAPAELVVVLDGKQHKMRLPLEDANVLDTALAAGLDLPYACKGGVCCTCRAKVLEGKVEMEKNCTLEPWEMEKGSCSPARRALTPARGGQLRRTLSCCWWHDCRRDYNGGTRSMRRIVRHRAVRQRRDRWRPGFRRDTSHPIQSRSCNISMSSTAMLRATRCARPWPRRPVPIRWSSCATTWPSAPSRMWTAPA